jgi:proteasome assembly chaperone (PAC2) family protein
VLEVLVGVLGIKVDMRTLERRARETERTLDRIRMEMELRMRREQRREEEEAWYIG